MALNRLLATYRVASSAGEIDARAKALAAEQSVEMPLEAIGDPRVLQEIAATVESIRPAGSAFEVTLGLAADTTGNEASQLANMLFGNCSLQPEVELLDVAFPPGYESAFPGPAFGIAGLRQRVHAPSRALTCTALKPQGSTVAHLAKLAGIFARAGIDVIKDDHGLANQAYSPFAERVPAVQRAIDDANRETGGHTLYAPTFSGGPGALAEQARIAVNCGVGIALVAPMLVGLPVFVEMRREHGLALLAHPAFAGASRVSPPLLLGKLFRLFGADATIFPNHGGRFSYSRETCLGIAAAARDPWNGIKPALPVPAGGMTVERVGEMIAGYGTDTMLLIGGGLLTAGDALLERSRDFVAKVASHGRCA
ncbi:MAG TPA: RuBisCO large subunit C-terminal-like domain-containing protein [Usitatibacteraceae bacterium]|nr:RuBisCO large subunit C-terminal-like domain-containing protein [Usitatibacteraceae bacterium]